MKRASPGIGRDIHERSPTARCSASSAGSCPRNRFLGEASEWGVAPLRIRHAPMEARVEHPGAKRRVVGDDPPLVIGIDLGTTNTAVAYADVREATPSGTPRVRVFDVPQLVAEGEVAARETLPSFLYLLGAEERGSGRLAPPWAPDAPHVVGEWARDHGALVPGRLVSSGKSWLCNDAVDRRAPLLPWGETGAVSPVDASAAYLAHVRDAWNDRFGAGRAGALRFERQSV